MTAIVQGNIFETQMESIVVPVNTVGIMGAGLAREVARKYPEAYRAYRSACDSGDFYIGKLILLEWTQPKLLMFPTKTHWREKSKMETLERGLIELFQYESRLGSLAIPALGCGLGGLAWENVLPLLQKYTQRLKIPVEIYAPRP